MGWLLDTLVIGLVVFLISCCVGPSPFQSARLARRRAEGFKAGGDVPVPYWYESDDLAARRSRGQGAVEIGRRNKAAIHGHWDPQTMGDLFAFVTAADAAPGEREGHVILTGKSPTGHEIRLHLWSSDLDLLRRARRTE